MRIIETTLSGVLILEPVVFRDERGSFIESFNAKRMAEAGIDCTFVQDNDSCSVRGVLRGLHLQTRNSQGKLVRVVKGTVFDVAVDLRKGSKTFSKWVGISLSDENKRMVWIPPGFAHGFLVTSEEAVCVYKTTDYYAPEFERTLAWDDATVGIQWPITSTVTLSKKDRQGQSLAEIESLL
jgi:dTDP-4-dehydrorhamnose 3,5-epimerase